MCSRLARTRGAVGWFSQRLMGREPRSGYLLDSTWLCGCSMVEIERESQGPASGNGRIGCEVLFNSGRSSNSPVMDASADSLRHPNSTTEFAPAVIRL